MGTEDRPATVPLRAVDDLQGCESRRRDGRRNGRGEDEASGPIDEQVAQPLAAGREPSGGAEGFPERRDEDVRNNPGGCAEPAALRSENAEGVGFINDE